MSKYDQQKRYGRALLHIFIDEDLKEALKAQAKRHGMLMRKYIEQQLKKIVVRNMGVENEK